MTLVQLTGTIIAGIFLVGTGLIYGASVSPRLMWALAPEDAHLQILYDRAQDKEEILYEASRKLDLQKYLPASVSEIPAKRFVYSRAGASEVLILAAPLYRQSKIQKTLAQDNWHIQRLGLLLRAARTPSPPASPPISELAQAFFRSPLPIRPILAVQYTSHVNNKNVQPVFVSATWENPTRIAVILSQNPTSNQTYTIETNSLERLNVALPSNVLDYIPASSTAAWETFIQQKLGFEKTDPNLREFVQTHTALSVLVQGETLALGVYSQNVALVEETIKAWFANEEAYRHPKRRAFRLPDGTVGYERIPGTISSAFSGEGDSDGCQESVMKEGKIWLCKGEEGIAVSSEKNLAKRLAAASPASSAWFVQLGQEYTKGLPFPHLEAVSAQGDTEGGKAWLHFQKLSP